MTTTMNLIAKQTVGAGGAASVTFSNIPQTFTDLKIVASAKTNNTANYGAALLLNFNSSSTGYSDRSLRGSGSSTSSYSNAVGGTSTYGSEVNTSTGSAQTNTFSNNEIYITNYTNSANKSISVDGVAEINDSTNNVLLLTAALWSNSAAINTIAITCANGPLFTEFSEFSLYGISNSTTTQNTTTPSASGGDIIRTDGSFWYHTFLYSGSFVPLKNLTCDYLVVAGGGSGASGTTFDRRGGAGGAGGYRTSIGGTALTLTSNTSYSVTVGSGAAASGSLRTPGTKGSDSVFSTITSTGGGFGSTPDLSPGNGGSGGGGGDGAGPGQIGPGLGNTPSTSPSQGNNGGAGQSTNGAGAGTGGGATAAGITSTASAGGAGATNSISGSSVTYSTGGPVISSGNGANATANTGNGGSGGGPSALAGNGGSGIVVVRYAV